MGNDLAAAVPDLASLRAAASGAPLRAAALYDLADGLAAIAAVTGDYTECAEVFGKAYRLNPAQRPALGRGPALSPAARAERLRGYAQGLIDHGVAYTSVIAALGVAESLLGHRQAVETLYDHDRFLRCWATCPPTSFSREDFLAGLIEASLANLRFYDDTTKVAFRQGWRNVDLMAANTPVLQAFEREMRRQVERYIAELPNERGHPFLAARPQDFTLDFWAVVSDGASHHLPHIHPRAWLTGVFYVERPEASRTPGSDQGWMTLSAPRKLAAAGDGWLTRKIPPEPGSLVLMPGYFFHGTQPVAADQRRICIAFDVRPSEFQVRLAHPAGY